MTVKGAHFRRWTQTEIDTLVKLGNTHSHSVMARKLNKTVNAVEQMYKRLIRDGRVLKRPADGFNKSNLVVTSDNDCTITLPHKYLDMMKANAEKALVFSDIHLPCIDWELFYLTMAVAKRQNIKSCVVGGDLFDYNTFSTFADAKKGRDGEDELTMGEQSAVKFFTTLLDQFEMVYVICGNHDFRIMKFSEGRISENKFFRFLTHISEKEKRVKFSAYRHMVLNDIWRVVHPNGGGDFVMEGRGEAVKYQQNIIVTHLHKMGWCFDPSGKLIALGCGAMLDPTTQSYIMTVPSKSPMWNTGFTIIQGKYFYAFPKYRTDWDKWTKTRFL